MIQRVMVGTDRSATAERAVAWAADLAANADAELHVVQVLPDHEAYGGPTAAEQSLAEHASALAGVRGRARVVVDTDPAGTMARLAHEERADVLVVGNAGMSGRREFLLANVPNRVSHLATCTVVIVNSAAPDGAVPAPTPPEAQPESPDDVLLTGRAAQIAGILAKHGLSELRAGHDGADARRERARRLRVAFEELGPTFSKLGQILSTRPDLVPPEVIEELSTLRDRVPPLSEAEIVAAMERELGVPWEDVFESIEAEPLAAGTIAQVHRATLTDHSRVVVKVQRPNARDDIMRDLGLLEVLASKTSSRAIFRQLLDVNAMVEHLSTSLRRELDFEQEAESIERMREVLEPYERLAVPGVHRDLSTKRLLVMEEIQGGPITDAPLGPARREAARQLVESYYAQVLSAGIFHADPHPGNLMWWNDRVYFLDFGMVGEVDPQLREDLTMLLLAFWQEDATFLTDITLMLAGTEQPADLELPLLREELGALARRYRHLPLREVQLGPILQEMTEIALRHGITMPASLLLTAKALAQVQLSTAELDPDLDPLAVAGRYMTRTTLHRIRESLDPQLLLYEAQKVRMRVTHLVEAVERVIGARPGSKLQVQFRGLEGLEVNVRRAGRRLSLALAAAGTSIATAITASAEQVPDWVPKAFGAASAVLTAGLVADVARGDRQGDVRV